MTYNRTSDLGVSKDPAAPGVLLTLTGRTFGELGKYLHRRRINVLDVRSVTFGAIKSPLPQKVGLATIIATKMTIIVHFSHRGIPVTAYPNVRDAAYQDYHRRREAGERVETEESLDDDD